MVVAHACGQGCAVHRDGAAQHHAGPGVRGLPLLATPFDHLQRGDEIDAPPQHRVGFDAFEVRGDRSIEDALKAFDDFKVTYQPSADEGQPLWRRRG